MLSCFMADNALVLNIEISMNTLSDDTKIIRITSIAFRSHIPDLNVSHFSGTPGTKYRLDNCAVLCRCSRLRFLLLPGRMCRLLTHESAPAYCLMTILLGNPTPLPSPACCLLSPDPIFPVCRLLIPHPRSVVFVLTPPPPSPCCLGQELQRRLDQTLGKPGSYISSLDRNGGLKPMTIGARIYRVEQQVTLVLERPLWNT